MSKLFVDEIHPKTTGGIITTTGLSNIKEQLVMLCDGNNYTVASGTYTPTNVTALQNFETTYADLNGSSIAYTPPNGTTMVSYKFVFAYVFVSSYGIAHLKFFIDSDEVTKARVTLAANANPQWLQTLEYLMPIGGSTDTTTGRQASWTSAKTLKIQAREYSSTNQAQAHATHHWDGTTGAYVHIPKLIITSLG